MRIAQDQPTFIFNFLMVNRTLGDIQLIVHSILTGRHPVLQRTSELLIRGLDKFIRGLDPVQQISNMGNLALDLGSLLKKGGGALWNDPIAAIDNTVITASTLAELLRNTAEFVSDLTVGKLFLPSEEYKKRIHAFCEMIEPLKDISTEHYVDFVAQVTADVVFCKGLGATYEFLKEIGVLSKLGESAASVARIFKKELDIYFVDNPIVVTAEGITFQMSNDLKNVGGAAKEIITNSRMFIESMTSGFLRQAIREIEDLKKIFTCAPNCLLTCTKRGFAEFKNGHIKIAYEHIFGMELTWAKEGLLNKFSGFHHDVMQAMEKSNAIQFINKIVKDNGCYSADLIIDGLHIPDKTFFPSNWSREKVVNKIYEAYNNFIKKGIIPELNHQGKYVIDGYTSEGIKIRMIITQKGHMKTAYPYFK